MRGPCGGGVNAGPYHSQNVESFFLNTPGLKIVAPSTPKDARGLIKSAIRDDDPVIFMEPKLMEPEFMEPEIKLHSLPETANGIRQGGADSGLFLAQGDQRIDPGRPRGGYEGGQKGHRNEGQGAGDKRGGVV